MTPAPAERPAAAAGERRSGPDMHEIRPRLWLGSYGAACDSSFLKERGVTHVLTVGVKADLLGARQRALLMPSEKDPLTRLIVAVRDTASSALDRHFDACSTFISSALSKGCGVLVHCQAGQSRSPTIVAAHLMREERLSAAEALESVKAIRPVVRPNCGFLDQLRAFELRLRLGTATPEEVSCTSRKTTETSRTIASVAPSAGNVLVSSPVHAEGKEDPSAWPQDEAPASEDDAESNPEEEEEEPSGIEARDPAPLECPRPAEDVFGTEELKLRSEKLKARYQQLRHSASLLALAAPLRKRRHMDRLVPRQVGSELMR